MSESLTERMAALDTLLMEETSISDVWESCRELLDYAATECAHHEQDRVLQSPALAEACVRYCSARADHVADKEHRSYHLEDLARRLTEIGVNQERLFRTIIEIPLYRCVSAQRSETKTPSEGLVELLEEILCVWNIYFNVSHRHNTQPSGDRALAEHRMVKHPWRGLSSTQTMRIATLHQ